MTGPAEEKAVRLVARGRVQGVFFRASMRTEAERLGVRGWVRNEDDGSVHAHLEGPAPAVEELVTWARGGPPKARVEGLDVTSAEPAGLTGFED